MLTKKEFAILKKSITLIGTSCGDDIIIPVESVISLLEDFIEEDRKSLITSYRSPTAIAEANDHL